MTMGDAQAHITGKGFITVSEPACGAGAMVIACAQALREQGVNYQRCMHVTATDLDATAAHMAYLQLSLLHIPAVVVHGNSLAVTEFAHWVTPAHVLGGWDLKFRRVSADSDGGHEVPRMPEVVSAAVAKAERPPSLVEVREVVASHRAEQLGLF